MPSTIDSRQLLAFATLARRQSFTETARVLFLTQSAISHAIRALEEDVGVRLFERLGKRVFLTHAGEQLLPSAERILIEMEGSRGELGRLGKWGGGHLRWAACDSVGARLLAPVSREFRRRFPACELKTEAGDGPRLLEWLNSGWVDLVLMMEPLRGESLAFRPLFESEMCLVVAPDHAWAAAGRVATGEAATETLLHYRCGRDTGVWAAARMARGGVRLRGTREVGCAESFKAMLRAGLGVGVLPAWMAERELAAGELRRLPLPGAACARAWGVAHLKAHALSLTEEAFVGVCAELAKGMGLPNAVNRAARKSVRARDGAVVVEPVYVKAKAGGRSARSRKCAA